ncbi:alpha/beta fold hydrolase [Capilliphycus salinus ALCB114379]|uniref:alpha/beta fold hydrolase n=1 Tax=Capilliphycus salinus TaxID=2768948 RepID=UPI0039A53756
MTAKSLTSQLGFQRDWIWRGWRIRYTYLRSKSNPTTPSENSPSPMIFLHGFGASIGHWRYSLQELSQSHTVYALDLLGFGASQKAIASYDTSLWADLVHDFWLTFIGEPTILVGNSVGSLVALVAAAQYPEMTKGVVAISLPDPVAQTEAVPGWMLPVVEAIQNTVASPPVLRSLFYIVRHRSLVRFWAKLAYENREKVNDELVDILATPATDRGAARAFSILFKVMGSSRLGPGVKSLLPRVNVPILLLWGKQDRLIPISFANPSKYLQYNSNIKFVQLERGGHCPQDECPELVHREILDWIASFSG